MIVQQVSAYVQQSHPVQHCFSEQAFFWTIVVSTGALQNINRPHTQEFFFWIFAGGTRKTKDMYHRRPKQELTDHGPARSVAGGWMSDIPRASCGTHIKIW